MSMSKRCMQACTIELFINKNLKLRKRKGEDKQCRLKFYIIFASHDRNLQQSVAICHSHNKNNFIVISFNYCLAAKINFRFTYIKTALKKLLVKRLKALNNKGYLKKLNKLYCLIFYLLPGCLPINLILIDI